jgi:acyl carrier protein
MLRRWPATWALALAAPTALALSGCASEKASVPAQSANAKAVKNIIAKHIGAKPETITDAFQLCGSSKLDSLDFVEIIMALEEEFSLTIDDQDALKMETVGDVVAYIEKVKA